MTGDIKPTGWTVYTEPLTANHSPVNWSGVTSSDPEAWVNHPDARTPAPEERPEPDPDDIGDGAIHDEHVLPEDAS